MSGDVVYAEPGTWLELLTDDDRLLGYVVGDRWPHGNRRIVAAKTPCSEWLRVLNKPLVVLAGASLRVAIA